MLHDDDDGDNNDGDYGNDDGDGHSYTSMHTDRAYHLRPQTSCLWAENSLTTLGPCEELVVVVEGEGKLLWEVELGLDIITGRTSVEVAAVL